MFNVHFNKVSELTEWLEKKNYEAESPEAFNEWLQNFFEEGNTITVGVFKEEYDFWACWELV